MNMRSLIICTYSVLLDDTDMFSRTGGGGYEYFGLDSQNGGIVVVRPDGYVGFMTPIDLVADLQGYFDGFMTHALAPVNGR